ncbi:hypothetical protein [Streptomyces sp. NPDC057582]|uniref:hypothetical protein n=1 Tax=Streptomyces sp. NPDC057582 TaxID=3346174 RepID=UPI0036C5B425
MRRLVVVTGWSTEPGEPDWSGTESTLGTPLPVDFKEPAWAAGERELSYTWKLPDGTDATTSGSRLRTAIPALLPGKSATWNKRKSKTIVGGPAASLGFYGDGALDDAIGTHAHGRTPAATTR